MKPTKKLICVLGLAALLSGCEGLTNQDVGVVTGGIVGGVVGNQFGGGTGRVVATTLGAIAGAYIGGRIGQSMDRSDRRRVDRALEEAPSGQTTTWENPDNGNTYTVTPTKTYYSDKQPCREFTTRAIIGGKQRSVYGKACRTADGSWRIVQ